MNKKLISLLLCLCIFSSLAVSAFAETKVIDDTGFDTPYGVDITAIAKNSDGTKTNHVYSVEIAWGNMQFAWGYVNSKESTWDPENHKWVETEIADENNTKEWYLVDDTGFTLEDTAADLTTNDAVLVFNHSSLPVDAQIAVTDEADVASIIASFNANGGVTANAETGKYNLVAAANESAYHDFTNNANAMVYGKVSLADPTPKQEALIPTNNAVTVAKLNVTISKPTT